MHFELGSIMIDGRTFEETYMTWFLQATIWLLNFSQVLYHSSLSLLLSLSLIITSLLGLLMAKKTKLMFEPKP
jgi:hypothetical protein